MDTNNSPAVADYRERLLKRGLSPRHREAMRLVASGKTIKQVAEQLGYCYARLLQITRSPLWRREMDRLQNRLDTDAYDTMHELRKLQPHCVQGLSDLIQQDEFKSIRLAAIRDVLDRTGVRLPDTASTITQTQTYEEQLSKVQVTYQQTTKQPNYIQVIGGEELASEDDHE